MCQDVTQQVTGSSISGNMLMFQASVSGSGQRFLCLTIASMALALSAHTPWVQLVSHVSTCWLTGLGFRHTSRDPTRTISWNACKLLQLLTETQTSHLEKRKDKKTKYYDFWPQLNEKPSVTSGCPGSHLDDSVEAAKAVQLCNSKDNKDSNCDELG